MTALLDAKSRRPSHVAAAGAVLKVWHGRTAFRHGALAKLIDWFIPASMRLDVEARRRALLFLVSHLIGPWLGLTIIVYLYWLDPHAGFVLWWSAAAIGAFWVYPFALRFSGRFVLLALLSVQNLAFVVLFVSYNYGGLSSPFLPWLITVPMLAFFYLGEDGKLRAIALGGLVVDLVIFYIAHALRGTFPSRVPLETLSTVGLVSVFCAGVYVTMMAVYYGRILASRSELEREVQRHQQTAVMLVEAKDAAESANRAKSEFLATMSHELRTPLNAVIGFSEIMVSEALGPLGHANYKGYAKDIHDSGSNLLHIINDILDISKAEAGSLELAEGVVNCRELIVASSRLFRPRLEKAELTLELTLPNGLPQLRADARMVRQIVLNLLTNAVKFTPPGGRVAIEIAADPQRGLVIAISDTGIGIAKADLRRVRKPFVQADGSLSRRHEGTGLGLPLVEMMTRQHGGSFELDSEQGKGTTARALFPAERLVWSGAPQDDAVVEAESAVESNDAPEATPREVPVAAPAGPADSFDTPRLLVVEDDGDLRDLLRRMLSRAGFATAGAGNGREALRHLQIEQVDLVITDMVMPEMDGVELMRVLQKDKPGLPVIALSGVEEFMEYRRIATHLGAKAALRKPVTRADLIRAVNDVLAQRPGTDAHEPALAVRA